MHAVVIRVTLNDEEADQTALENDIVPRVRQAPGFVTGYWTRKDKKGLSMVVFDGDEQARTMSEQVPAMVDMLGGAVTLDEVEVREVVAHA